MCIKYVALLLSNNYLLFIYVFIYPFYLRNQSTKLYMHKDGENRRQNSFPHKPKTTSKLVAGMGSNPIRSNFCWHNPSW